MTREALLSEILRLSPEEQIDLLEEAWDSIAASPNDVPMPEWHVAELQRRLEEPNPQFVRWDEVKDQLKDPAQR